MDNLLACAQIELAKLLQQKVRGRDGRDTPILIFHLYILTLRSIRSLITAHMCLLR